MMRILPLTRLASEPFSKEVWIVAERIIAFFPWEGGTRIFTSDGENSGYWDVLETPQQILAMLPECTL
jgi:hypothetical protein